MDGAHLLHARNVGATGGANVSLKFTCSGTVGAFMNLQDTSTKTSVSATGQIPDYILRHHERWDQYSVDHNLGLKSTDMIMVKGFVKTSVWSVAAYRSGMKQSRAASLTGKLGPLGEAGFEVEVSTKTGYLFDTRYGPLHREQSQPVITPPITPSSKGKGKGKGKERIEDAAARMSSAASVVPQSGLPHDQCIFLSYYRLKRRMLLPWKLIAKAEDKDLPDDDEDDDEVVANDQTPPDLTVGDPIVPHVSMLIVVSRNQTRLICCLITFWRWASRILSPYIAHHLYSILMLKLRLRAMMTS